MAAGKHREGFQEAEKERNAVAMAYSVIGGRDWAWVQKVGKKIFWCEKNGEVEDANSPKQRGRTSKSISPSFLVVLLVVLSPPFSPGGVRECVFR